MSDAELLAAIGMAPQQAQAPATGMGQAPAAMQAPSQPRGVRNANEGNLKDGPFARRQPGYQGADANGFAVFATPDAGRAAQESLLANNYAGMSLGQAIGRYAPVGPENSPESVANYVRYVGAQTGLGQNDTIRPEHIPALAQAMREFENGQTVDTPMRTAPPDDLTALSDDALLAALGQDQQQATALGSQTNPIDLANLTNDSVARLTQGAWVTNSQTGETYQLPGDAYFGRPDSSADRVGRNVYIDRPDMGDRALAAATAFSEQIPFGDELVAAGAGALSGRGYDAIREQQMLDRELLNQTNRGDRIAGGLAGFGAGFALPGGKWVEGATGAARAGRAAALGAGYGSLYGAGNTDGDLKERLAAAGIQGALGAGAGAVLQRGADAFGARAAAARANPSPARQLSAAGVDLTPGQMMGGAAQRLEDAATSVPILGDSIRNARIRGLETFNTAALNQALEPIGATATRGRQGIAEADRAVSQAYDNALQGVIVPRDGAFDAQITHIARSNPLPGELQGQFGALLNNTLNRIGQGMDGQAWKQLDSEIGAAVRSAQNGSQTNPAQRLMADKLMQVQDAVRGMLSRANPTVADEVSRANEAAAGMYRVRDASQGLGAAARDGLFTPGDLNRAVRAGDSSAGNRQYARGEAMMQDLSDAAAQVLPSTVPDSGTALRSLFTVAPALGAGAGAGAVGVPLAAPAAVATGAGLFGGASAYSRPVQSVLNRAYRASTPGAARQALADLQKLAGQSPVLQPVYEALQSALRPLLLSEPTATPTTR